MLSCKDVSIRVFAEDIAQLLCLNISIRVFAEDIERVVASGF